MKAFGGPQTLAALAAALLLVAAPDARAALITVDFNLPAGTHLTSQYLSEGVLFSGHDVTGDRPIAVGIFGPTPDGTIVLDTYSNGLGSVRADFTVPVSYVSMDYRLFEGTGGPLSLSLFDATGHLRASNAVWAIRGLWYTLEATAATPDVAYAVFTGENEYHVNAVQNDNLAFGTVPEPSTLLLFGSGLICLARASKRKR